MGYLPKRDVISSIKSRIIKHGDGNYTIFEAYFGTDPFTQKPIRLAAKNQKKLERKIEEFYKKLSVGGDAAVRLTAYQALDAMQAFEMIARSGLNMTLTECVRQAVEKKEEPTHSEITLSEAFNKYFAQQESKSIDHQKSVKIRVGKWVQIFGSDRFLSDVTPQEVNKDLETRFYDPQNPKTKTTYNNNLTYIKSFMNWCAAPEQGFIKESPIATMKLMTKEWRDPEYMHAKDVATLFKTLEKHKDEYPEDLADAILSFFCGMRQDEIKRVREGDNAVRISLENRNIRVIKCKGASKGIKPRSFTIPNIALAWMQSFDFMSAVKIKNDRFRRHLIKRAQEAGITLPKNAGRHTFITMHSAAYHDQNLLTSIVGNTDDVRGEYYDGLTFENEGKAYFEILPSSGSL